MAERKTLISEYTPGKEMRHASRTYLRVRNDSRPRDRRASSPPDQSPRDRRKRHRRTPSRPHAIPKPRAPQHGALRPRIKRGKGQKRKQPDRSVKGFGGGHQTSWPCFAHPIPAPDPANQYATQCANDYKTFVPSKDSRQVAKRRAPCAGRQRSAVA